MEKYIDLIARFSDVKVLVIGDIMLDRYWWGSVSRISPEAPVPVVQLEKTSLVPGGAANVAANVNSLGASAFLVGVIGNDEEGRRLSGILEQNGISSEFLYVDSHRPTTAKTRIVAHHQHVVRIDHENKTFLDLEQEASIWLNLENLFEEIDLMIISDYAKGFLSRRLLARLITKGKEKNKPVLVDPKGKDYTKYTGATILTPNQREAREACRLDEEPADADEDIAQTGRNLIETLSLESLLITRGEKGMTLIRDGFEPAHFKTQARDVYDVTGAGDTVIATLGVALGAKADLLQAVDLSNIAAGLVVEEVGTTTISIEKLKAALAA